MAGERTEDEDPPATRVATPVGAAAKRALLRGRDHDKVPRLEKGQRLGRYEIRALIGRGGMGEVYRANDTLLDRAVAVKVLLDSGDAGDRLVREAKALARLHHPNVVAVYDAGETDGLVYLAMHYVEGENLAVYLHRRQHRWSEIIALYVEAGRGLAAAHAAGMVHRDFKASNVLIDRAGKIAVTDFGIARAVDPLGSEPPPEAAGPGLDLGATANRSSRPALATLTQNDEFVGTPPYMAWEQFQRTRATPATDVYAFCVALWESLFKIHPYLPAGIDGTLYSYGRALEDGKLRVPPRHAVPRRVIDALARGLRREPSERWPDMGALLDELVQPPPRNRLRLAAGALAVVAAAVVVIAIVDPFGADHPAAPAAAPSAALPFTPPPPVQLTNLGGCAYSPTFVGDDTVVFDLTKAGSVDLYRLGLAPGAEPVRLTEDAGWEWRSSPGAPPNEVVFMVESGPSPGVDAVDLVTRARRRVFDTSGATVWATGAYYHAPSGTNVLRRLRSKTDEPILNVGVNRTIETMVAAPDQQRLAVMLDGPSATTLCTIELANPTLACLDLPTSNARPAFSSNSAAIYYSGPRGIHRVSGTGAAGAELVPGVHAWGGIAVSPSGRALVYSECGSRQELISPLDDPERPIVDASGAEYPVFGPGGVLVYLDVFRPAPTIFTRSADERVREYYARAGATLGELAIAPDGDALAFVVLEKSAPGIYVSRLSSSAAPNRLTESADDRSPVFAGEHVMFTRFGADRTPRLMRVARDGSGAEVVSTRPRITIAAAGDRVLLAAPDALAYYWWDAATGRESAGPKLPTETPPRDVALSPDGRWLLFATGGQGRELWRQRTDEDAPATLVYQLREDLSTTGVAIDDRGHPMYVRYSWVGDLWIVRAPPGATW